MPAIQYTSEFKRIASLPRRVLTVEAAEALARELTPLLTRPGSVARERGLRPWQAVSLVEADHPETPGALLALPVGIGKTLILELLPVVLGCEGRAVLIMPASLRDKTYADRSALLRDGWLLANPPARILTREEIHAQSGEFLLEQIRPSLIMIDEADELSNADAATPSRIDRYVLGCDERGETCIVVPATGTPSRNSIMGYWHLLGWALGQRSPLPSNKEEVSMWALLLDEKPKGARGVNTARRPDPGPMGATREQALEWYSRRLRETPGVVIVDEDSAEDVPLTIEFRYARECPEIDQHYERFLVEGVTPGGLDVTDPLREWQLDQQLGCGVEMYYDPPPPLPWALARRASAKFVRWAIEDSRRKGVRPLDTEGQVFKHYAQAQVVRDWLAIKDTFKPNSRTRWLSSSAVQSAIDWVHDDERPGVIMTGLVEVGEAIAKAGGLAYYGQQGRDAAGRQLHAADPSRSFVASWNANKRGFNLQAWSRMLLINPPTSARWLEQIIGRVHRSGQLNPVTITILVTSGGSIDAWESALAEARFSRATVSLTQKILRAEIIPPRVPARTDTNKFRWAGRSALAAA